MFEILQAKHAVLLSQREQLIGQINMTNGAIAICEEMIREALAIASEVTSQSEADEPAAVAA